MNNHPATNKLTSENVDEAQKPLPGNISSVDQRVIASKKEILPGLFWAEGKKTGTHIQGYLLHHSNAPLWRGPVEGKTKIKALAKKAFSKIDWTRGVLELQKDAAAVAALRAFEKSTGKTSERCSSLAAFVPIK